MKVGFDASAATQRAGIGRYTAGLLRGLQAVLPERTLVLTWHSGGPPPAQVTQGPALDRIVRLPFSSHVGEILWQRLCLPVPIELFTGPVSVFHGPNYMLPPLRHAHGVVTIHDLSFLRCPQYAHPGLAAFLNRAVRRSAQRATAILADSRNTAVDVFELLGVPQERIRVAYPGVGPPFGVDAVPGERDYLRARFGLERPYFLCVGTIEPRKNYGAIAKAFLEVRSKGFPGELVVAGAIGWGAAPALCVFRETGNSIRLLTAVTDDELAALYRHAVALVYAPHYEGFGLPALEAMASGTPLILARNSSLPEVGGEAAFYCDTSAQSIAAAMLALLEAGQMELQERIQCGLQRARRFTWESMASEVLEVYRALA